MTNANILQLTKLRHELISQIWPCVAMIVIIHVLPKPHGAKMFRLLLTVAYFAAATRLAWLLNEPRARYLKGIYAWRFSGAGPALEQSSRMYLSSINRLWAISTRLLLVFLVCCAISVISGWFPGLNVFPSITSLGLWCSLGAIMLFPMWGRRYLEETRRRHVMLRDSMEMEGFRLPDDADLERPRITRATVESAGDQSFVAGGFTWSWNDFTKSCVVFGATGSGKTVCVLNAILDGLLLSTSHSALPCGGLILDPKGDFLGKLRFVCRKHGRESDVVTINPSSPSESIRWNPLDSDADELELAGRFVAALEALGMKNATDSFWIDSAKTFIRHAIALLRLTNFEGEPPSLLQIRELASSLERLSEAADNIADDDPRGDDCLAYFDSWIKLDEKPRTSIQAYITNMIDPFLMEPYKSLFSGRSSVRIREMLVQGKILYVYMPIAETPAMAKVICTFVKLEYFREVLRSRKKRRPTFFLCDEFQSFFTSVAGNGDQDFFAVTRESNHANVIATQLIPGMFNVAENRENAVNTLLSNCRVKIFLRNDDEKTNTYASGLFGQKIVLMQGSSTSQGTGKLSRHSTSYSQHSQYDQAVRPEVFSRLAVPGSEVDYAETIVHLGTRQAKDIYQKLNWRVHPLQEKK